MPQVAVPRVLAMPWQACATPPIGDAREGHADPRRPKLIESKAGTASSPAAVRSDTSAQLSNPDLAVRAPERVDARCCRHYAIRISSEAVVAALDESGRRAERGETNRYGRRKIEEFNAFACLKAMDNPC